LKTTFKKLSISTNLNCNLKCDYCLIDKTINKDSKFLLNQTKNAYLDNTFLDNTKKVLSKLNISPNDIDCRQM
jgi:sulfatase maturation enzyme AslB (radical SAM superfamily)